MKKILTIIDVVRMMSDSNSNSRGSTVGSTTSSNEVVTNIESAFTKMDKQLLVGLNYKQTLKPFELLETQTKRELENIASIEEQIEISESEEVYI